MTRDGGVVALLVRFKRSTGDERQQLMSIGQLDSISSVRQNFEDYTFNPEGTVSRHVKISGSPSVMSTVCSKWADNEPS